MKRTNYIQKIFAVVFTTIVLFTVTVRETHYLFADHHSINEHCENHLHSQEEHGHCSVCKFDASLFTDILMDNGNICLTPFAERFIDNYQSLNLQSSIFNRSLRGPPSLA